MAVPDYQSIMLPLLEFAEEQKVEVSTGDAVEALGSRLGLTDDDLKEVLPSGVQRTFVNRVSWAATYMKKAGLPGTHSPRLLSNHSAWKGTSQGKALED
jgi:restriction system protein